MGSTYDVLVGDDFEEKHEHCDEVQEVADQLEDVHPSRVKINIAIKI